jgi:WD40 repeat protein
VRLWNAATGLPQGVLEGHLDEVHDLAFSPDGRLASSSWDKTIRLWNPASGQTLLVFKWRTGRGPCIKFSPDGRVLASADFDRTIKLWEAAPESALATRADQERANP